MTIIKTAAMVALLWVAFAADLLIFFPSLGVDFATNAIYMPHNNKARIVTKMK